MNLESADLLVNWCNFTVFQIKLKDLFVTYGAV